MTNPDPSSSGLLTRLSASPSGSSSSSLTSSSSFDPHAPPDDEKDASVRAGPSTLGLRELARMRKEEKRAEQEAITPRARNETTGPGAGAGAGSERRREVKLVSSVIGSGAGTGTELPFATDVQIRGWKVVGGRSWTDIGRIGAYVGMYQSQFQSQFQFQFQFQSQSQSQGLDCPLTAHPRDRTKKQGAD